MIGDNMPRTIIELECKNPELMESTFETLILPQAEFKLVNEKGEEYWTNTVCAANPCIKYTFEGNKLILEGWVKIFRLGSLFKSKYSEKELKGLEAKLCKNLCKKVMDGMVELVEENNKKE